MADEDSLVSAWQHSGFHAVRQCLQRSLPSPRLSDGYQMALIVHMHNRLYAEHGAYRGGGGGNAPAPLEVIQIVNGEPVAHVQLFAFNKVPHLLYGRALFLFLRGIVCYHALAEGRGECIHSIYLSVGVLFPELARGGFAGIICGAESCGEAYIKYIFPLLEKFFHFLLESGGIHCGGLEFLSFSRQLIELLKAYLPSVQPVAVIFSVRQNLKRKHLKAKLIRQFLRQVAGRISQYHIFVAHIVFVLPEIFFINGNIIP